MEGATDKRTPESPHAHHVFEPRDSGYNTFAFMSDAVDGRSAARYGNTIVRQHVTFPQIPLTLSAAPAARLRGP
eukprot:677868-Prymnesium_polylepis.1